MILGFGVVGGVFYFVVTPSLSCPGLGGEMHPLWWTRVTGSLQFPRCLK